MTPKDLLAIYGTQRAAAQAIGVSKQAISLWRSKGKIPLEYQIEFERVTNQALLADLPGFIRFSGQQLGRKPTE
jgi:DNA-binding transcriptional regulator Cro